MSANGDFDYLPYAIEQLTKLQEHHVYVGAFKVNGDNSVDFLQMILGVQENGATIVPKNGKYLTIPTPYAAGLSARQIPNLFYYTTKSSGRPALARVDDGVLHVYFLLAESVVIPARPVMASTMAEIDRIIRRVAAEQIALILQRKAGYRDVLDKVGALVSQTLRANIDAWTQPPNAKITVANKGFNDPLVNTGELRDSIDWMVI